MNKYTAYTFYLKQANHYQIKHGTVLIAEMGYHLEHATRFPTEYSISFIPVIFPWSAW